MSLMNQAQNRAKEIQSENDQAEANRILKSGEHLEQSINNQPWMKGMPPAKYIGRKSDRILGSIPGRCNPATFAMFSVDDITIGIRIPTGGDNHYDHHIMVECVNEGCTNPTWVFFSRYQSTVTLVDIAGRALTRREKCCQCVIEEFHRLCPTCGK